MNKVFTISAGLVLLCIWCSGCCSREDDKNRKEPPPSTPSHGMVPREDKKTEKERAVPEVVGKDPLIHIRNAADFQTYVLESGMPCLVDFYSDHCPPCRMLAPVMEKLAKEYEGKVRICKVCIDIPANREIAARYSFQYIPTVIFLKDGKEVTRITGLKPEKEYREILDGMIAKKTGGDT